MRGKRKKSYKSQGRNIVLMTKGRLRGYNILLEGKLKTTREMLRDKRDAETYMGE